MSRIGGKWRPTHLLHLDFFSSAMAAKDPAETTQWPNEPCSDVNGA